MQTPIVQLASNLFLFLLVVIFLILYLRKRGTTHSNNSISMRSAKHFPMLQKFSRDMTEQARRNELDPVIGRKKEIDRVIQTLSRRTKNNPVIIGPSGVGKTAIVEGLAQEIVRGNVPDALRGKRVLALDLSSIIADTKYRGEFESRVKRMTNEIIQNKRHIILFIDEIHTLAGAGDATGAIDADDILKPPLARGDLQVVGATTPEEYKRHIKPDATLDRRLQPILVREPTLAETKKILLGLKHVYEQHHHVLIPEKTITEAIRFSKKYLPHRHFPDKVIDIIDEAAAKVHLRRIQEKKGSPLRVVTTHDVKAVIAEMNKIV